MEEVRQLVQEEGREARNLVAFHVAVDSPGKVSKKPPRAPSQMLDSPVNSSPIAEVRGRGKDVRNDEETSGRVRSSSSSCNNYQSQTGVPCNRVRSASTGRDKKSELQARYWGLLFGNLQRAIGEIYNIVEAHENLNECQEVILVLENYTRDFKSLSEWFRLKWEYDNTPPPQRPLSLAWEVRKTSPAKPEIRRPRSAKSSPSMSGKNSPCLSGKTSPCPSNGKISPSMKMTSSEKISSLIAGCLSPKQKPDMTNVFCSITEKIVEGEVMETRRYNSDGIDSKLFPRNDKIPCENSDLSINNASCVELNADETEKTESKSKALPDVEIGTATEFPSLPTPRKAVIVKKKVNANSPNIANVESSGKDSSFNKSKTVVKKNTEAAKKKPTIPHHVKQTTDILDALENEHIKSIANKHISEETPIVKNLTEVESFINDMKEKSTDVDVKEEKNVLQEFIKTITDTSVLRVVENANNIAASPSVVEDANAAEKKDKSAINTNVAVAKPAYSQAVSKPKSSTAILGPAKPEVKATNHLPLKTSRLQNRNAPLGTKITRSKTIAEIKQGSCRRAEMKNVNKTNSKQSSNRNAGSYPFNLTVGRGALFENNAGRGQGGGKGDADRFKYGSQSPRPNTLHIKKETSNNKASSGDKIENGKNYQKSDYKHESSRNTLKPFSSNLDDMCSSSETLVNSRVELSHVESNESIRTLCPDNEINLTNNTFAGSVEVLNVIDDNIVNEKGNDGWLTVKSKRLNKSSQSKKSASHWANRYNQPSATASLPTLNTIESPKDGQSNVNEFAKLEITVENNSNVKDVEKKPNKPAPKLKKEKRNDTKKIVLTDTKNNSNANVSSTNMIRQKSDVTGLKTKGSKDKFQKSIKMLAPESDIEIKNIDLNKIFKNNKFLPRSKKIRNKCIKMHFSYEDLSECEIEAEAKISELKFVNFVPKFEVQDVGDKTSGLSTVHLSLESLNSDSCFSTSLEQITNINDKFTLSDMSIDTDSCKQNSLNKSSEIYDGDNDDEIKDSIDNIDSDANEIEMMTNQIEENERKMDLALDWQSEIDQRKLAEEEELLNQQIEELQKGCDFDMDTETDDTETDGEILCEEEEDDCKVGVTKKLDNRLTATQSQAWYSSINNGTGGRSSGGDKEDRDDEEMSLEDRFEPILANLDRTERMDTLAALESLVARDPGRAPQLHAKLSHSMRRRGSLQETLKRYQAKQARAEQHRRALQKERSTKLQQLLTRVEDVKGARLQLIEEKRVRMEQRLQRAAENRDQRLKDIVRKAHDEDEKLREIAFIKQLEAANKRHDFLEQCREQTSRLREVRADRMRRLEEKAAKEAAVEERRKALETERMMKLDKMRETRRQREERVGRQQLQKEKERAQLAEEKARGRSERLSALLAAQAATAQALRRRITMKQKETARRHQETISQIKQKALELSLQRPDVGTQDTPRGKENKPLSEQENRPKTIYEGGKKTLTNSGNKLSNFHEPSPPSEDDGGVPEETKSSSKDKNKAQKKKIKKIKQRLLARGLEFEDTYEIPSSTEVFSAKSKMSRSINQIANIVQRSNAVANMNNTLTVKNTNVCKNGSVDSKLGGSAHSSMSDLSKSGSVKNETVISGNSVNSHQLERFLGELVRMVAKQTPQEKLAWQRTGFLVLDEILSICLNDSETNSQASCKYLMQVCDLYSIACHRCPQNSDYLVQSNKIVNLVDIILQRLQWCAKGKTILPVTIVLQHALAAILKNATSAVGSRMSDLVSYMISSGLVDNTMKFSCSVQNPSLSGFCDTMESSFDLLTAIVQRCAKDGQSEACKKMGVALKETDLAGALRSVYNAMMAPTQEEELSKSILRIANAAMKLFTAAAEADLHTFQDTLTGNSGLQFRHIIASLLRHAVRNTDKSDDVLHVILPTIGYFAINNKYNQSLLSSGTPPCVIQQLSMLPFRYFSVAEHKNVLLPVLLACSNHCPRTKHLLGQEVSQQLLDDFKASEDGKKSKLISIMTPPPASDS